jgi:NTP pyrophosphatase (non-canonical NTP hydrolase)
MHFGINFSELQRQCREWEQYNFPDSTGIQNFIGVVEEVGELAHFMLKGMQGIREGSDGAGKKASTEAHMMDAVGDITIFLINYCNKMGWSFDRIVAETWEEVRQRDFRKFPKNGRTE